MAGLLPVLLVACGQVAPASASVPANDRAWELVTPADPVSATVLGVGVVGGGGNRVFYSSLGAMPGAEAGDLEAPNLAVRTPDGWRTEPVGAPYSIPHFDSATFLGTKVVAASADLSSFVLSSNTPLTPDGPPEPRTGIYRRQGAELDFIADLGASEGSFLGASDDTARVVFSSMAHLLPGDSGRAQGESVYEWVGSTLRQVDVATDGSLLSSCGSTAGAGGVSDSGERIFFTNPTSCGSAPSRVYLRESGAETIEVSASRCDRPDCNGPKPVAFAGATPSGSAAFVTTAQQLTDADQNEKRDLYRFDVGDGALDLLSPGSAGMEGEVAGERVLTSTDGSTTYFYADGRLLPGQGVVGGSNLYLADEDGLRFVAPVGANDPIEISVDGRTAAILTAAKLATGDTDQSKDVYLYDADGDDMTRLSNGPGGGNGPFDANIVSRDSPGPPQPLQALTDDGRRVFFDTAEALTVDDHNQVGDVYEWSAGGLGLISDGAGEDPAGLTGMSGDGGTVLFKTAASLLPRDRDGGDVDIYAARLGGGFEESAQPETGCERCAEPSPLLRPEPASTAHWRRGSSGRIGLRRLDDDAASEIVGTGRTVLEVSVPSPGRVSARARGRLGEKAQTLARGEAGAVRPGRLGLELVVNPTARRELRRGGVLRLRLELRQGELHLARTVTIGPERAR